MNRFQRAIQIWALLVCAARERKTYTYGDLAKIFGFERAGTMGQFLAPIMYYCQQQKLPPLTVLVVNKETEMPGEGFEKAGWNLRTLQGQVYACNWFALPFPTVEALAQSSLWYNTKAA